MFKISVVASNATYSLVSSVASVNEGSNVNVTLTTTGVQRGQSVPFVISGSGVSLEDFEGLTSLTGSFVVGADGTSTINLSVKADQTTEGPETFTVALLGGQASVNVLLNDTSLMAALLPNTVLLLRANGTNNQNNNVFVDSSSNNFAITRNGNVTQGSFTPFSRPDGQWGVFFDGNGDYLQIPSSSALAFGTGDFTVESWINPTAWTSVGNISALWGDVRWQMGYQSGWCVFINSAGNIVVRQWGTVSAWDEFASSGIVSRMTWTHIAISRAAGTIRLFVNGMLQGTRANTRNYTNAEPFKIGAAHIDGVGSFFNGLISNVRVVKGTALYTSNFTPSTTLLTAITNTQLLTCQSNRFVDTSTNNAAISAFGDVRVVADSPFPSPEYNPTTMGGSLYFSAPTTQHLTSSGTIGGFGTNDFTVETWVYPSAALTTINLFDNRPDNTNGAYFMVSILNTGAVQVDVNGSARITSVTGLVRLGEWTHIAASRVGGVTRVFVNGTQGGSSWTDNTNYIGTTSWRLGANAYLGGRATIGYVAGYNVVSTGKYAANFTPPSAPVVSTPQTSLLLNFTNGGIVDSTGRNVLETVGDARTSTAVVRPGHTSSMFFDGTGDFITVPSSADFDLGATDFTIECWFNAQILPTAHPGRGLVSRYQSSGGSTGWILMILNSTTLRFVRGADIVFDVTVPTLVTGTWYHIAVSRSGNSLRMFLNGSQIGATQTITNFLDAATTVQIGRTHTVINDFNGYIDDLRITRGQALYTANFTPPTAL